MIELAIIVKAPRRSLPGGIQEAGTFFCGVDPLPKSCASTFPIFKIVQLCAGTMQVISQEVTALHREVTMDISDFPGATKQVLLGTFYI